MACIISAPSSGSGKTLLSLLLISWLQAEKKNIQTFKIGPDYLDPQQLRAVSRKPCRNLDLVISGKSWVKENFHHHGGLADASFIEGVMGLYDGIGSSTKGSTAEVAKLLSLPVVLIVNARGQAASLAALIKGFKDLDPEIKIAGVVLNNVRTIHHRDLLKEVLNKIGIKLLGSLPNHPGLKLEIKNLGLAPAHEIENISNKIELWSSIAKSNLDLEAFRHLVKPPNQLKSNKIEVLKEVKKPFIKIAIADDNAFHFRYPETTECLESIGIETLRWKPTEDQEIPKDAKGLIIPGGFPEEFAEQISKSKRSINSLKSFYGNKPIYAECGGMLFLGEQLRDRKGNDYNMAGILPFKAIEGSLNVGYRKLKSKRDSIILSKGEKLVGHEFHRWKLKLNNNRPLITAKELKYPWEIKAWGNSYKEEGWSNNFLHASWIHLHWPSSPSILKSWKSTLLMVN